ncbi:MAG: hypothetical protein HY717_13695, partial [Planctomycetes bacterium]|nr:hypothetical protein [Planctomycetota bacterium]
ALEVPPDEIQGFLELLRSRSGEVENRDVPVIQLEEGLDLRVLGRQVQHGADANADGTVDVSDAIVTLTYKFLGGEPPAAPGPERCGVDPTAEGLAYDSYPACKN